MQNEKNVKSHFRNIIESPVDYTMGLFFSCKNI